MLAFVGFATMCVVSACNGEDAAMEQRLNEVMRVSEMEYKGHDYIIAGEGRAQTVIHNPDCRCYIKEQE